MPWAGLILALVGVNARRRWIALGVAVGLDAVFAAERALRGGALTVGNGPTIVLTALMLVAWLRWSGTERRTALRAAALGALLIVATKVGDAWLEVTILTRPTVLDQYVVLADSALGDPSWVAGRVLDEVGPAASALLHWVYIELPVAAMVVAVWQLRHVASGVWPRHYLVRTFLVLGLVGPLIYVLFPVVGPVFAYGVEGEGHQIGNYWPGVVPPFDPSPAAFGFDDETPRNCMPSMHTAWALAVCLHAWRGPTWLRCVGVFWLVCTLSATLGFGYHYGVDLVAGAVLCLTVEAALRDPKRGWGWFRWRVVGGGAVLLAMLLISYRFLSVAMAQFPVLFGVLVLGSLAGYAYAWFATFRGPVRRADLPSAHLRSEIASSSRALGRTPARSVGVVGDGNAVAGLLFAVGDAAEHVGDHRDGDDGEQRDQHEHPGVGIAAQADRRAAQDHDHGDRLRLGRWVHPREGVAEADDADRGGEGEHRAEDDQRTGDDVEGERHRPVPRRCSRVVSGSSGTRNRATLAEPRNPTSDRATIPGTTVVSPLYTAHTARPQIATAMRVSMPTMRSSVFGPASTR